MRRSPYTSDCVRERAKFALGAGSRHRCVARGRRYSAVVVSSLLVVAFRSALLSARSLQDTVHGILPTGAENEPDETGAELLSHVRSSGAVSPKAERVGAGDPVSLRSNALQFGPHADVKLPHQIPLPRYFSGYFHKQKDAAVRETKPKLVDRAGSQVKPLASFRRKRWTDSSMKVHCWNEVHVFDVVLPASEVAKHFPHQCQHPRSCNTTCVAKAPGRVMCARLKSGCTDPILHAVPETLLGAAQNKNKQLASFEKNVERSLREPDAKLAQLSLESSYHKNNLAELGLNFNHLGDALKEQLAEAPVKTLHSLDHNAAERKALLNKKTESLMTAISSVFSLVQSDSKTHLWTLKGYAAKKAEAIKHGFSVKMSEKVYIGRYLISWGIYFEKSTGGTTLHLIFQLHRGINDEFLEWPFSNELKVSIIHSKSGEKLEGRQNPPRSQPFMQYYSRPVWASNPWVIFKHIKFESSYLERNGYVNNDQLLLKLEVL